MKNTHKQRGIALIYLSIVLFIGSLSIILGTRYYNSFKDANQNIQTEYKLQKIEDALVLFTANNLRLPCPASIQDSVGSTTFGEEARLSSPLKCDPSVLLANSTNVNLATMYMGVIPFKTLGLSPEFSIDAWGNKIEYAVLATTQAPNITMGLNGPVSNFVIKDSTDNTLTNSGAYVLISRGKNQYGAIPYNNTNRLVYPPLELKADLLNLGCNPNTGSCTPSDFTRTFQKGNGKIGDDIIRYKSRVKPLTTDCKAMTANTKCDYYGILPLCQLNEWRINGITNTFSSPITINGGNSVICNVNTGTLYQSLGRGSAYKATIRITSLSNTGDKEIAFSYDNVEPHPTYGYNIIVNKQIALFNKNKLSSTFPQTITINFGKSTDYIQKMYFTVNGNTGNASMTFDIIDIKTRTADSTNLAYSVWDNPTGCTVSSCAIANLTSDTRYPSYPSYTNYISNAESQAFSDHLFTSVPTFGSKIEGYFTPDITGKYTFYLASNTQSVLYFSTNDNPSNATLVASRTTASATRDWSTSSGNSSQISLEGGKSYYFYLLHTSTDPSLTNLSVGCSRSSTRGITPIGLLGTGTDTAGCAGVLSTAPMKTVLSQRIFN